MDRLAAPADRHLDARHEGQPQPVGLPRRDGDAVEYLGSYNPNAKGNPLTIKLDRFDYWVPKGAKPSDTVASLVKRSKRAAVAKA